MTKAHEKGDTIVVPRMRRIVDPHLLYSQKDFTDIGTPWYEKFRSTIWALHYVPSEGTYPYIKSSDDYGENWKPFYTFAPEDIKPNSLELFRSSSGDFYYNGNDDKSYGLYRVSKEGKIGRAHV
jgi:hypothetical protein